MTECITDPFTVSSLSRRKIQADFNGGKLTSDGGGLLLREVDRRLGLIDQLNECLPDPRNPALILHSQRTLLAQRIFGLALGYEDLNDHQRLRDDPLLQTITERGLSDEQPLASPPTLCRLENRISRESLVRMARVFVEQFIASYGHTPPEELSLDLDATV